MASQMAAGPSQQWARSQLELLRVSVVNEDSILAELAGEQLRGAITRAVLLSSSGAEVSSIQSDLDHIIADSKSEIHLSHLNVSPLLRHLYCDACIVRSLLDLYSGPQIEDTVAFWKTAISRLDIALIVSGAPGEGRLDLIYSTIKKIQQTYLPSSVSHEARSFTPSFASSPLVGIAGIPRLAKSPAMSAFQQQCSKSPFILPAYVADWPAMTDRPWSSITYLREVAGRGRVVPIEVGPDYTRDGWDQRFMDWDEFLDAASSGDEGGEGLYLAQHNLLTQFPELRSDIILLDYVYSCPSAPEDFPQYKPPLNDEELVLNAWLGPKGTLSPAHTDPYFNCYAQVVGYKTVWLAPPSVSESMYPHPAKSSMSNTTQVDVFNETFESSDQSDFPLFHANVKPKAMMAILEPGDLLCFPPGWWHGMRSESTSFSVSMWF